MRSEICCAGCGFRAPDPEFFRRERDGVLGRKRVFCLGCAPYAPHRFETASYVIPLCFIPAGALLLAFDPKAESIGKDGYWILFMGVLILAQMLTTVAHEFGHAALAHLMGMRVIAVTIGTGPLLTSIRLNSLVVSVHRFLLTGGATHFYDDSASPSKLRAASVTLGGILVNLFIVAGGLAPFVWMSMTHRSIPTLAIVVAYAALASQAIAIIENAWPREARVGHTRVPTDGRQLLVLLRSKDFQQRAAMTQLLRSGLDLLERYRYAEAQAHFERASVLFPSDLCFRSLALHCVSKTAGPLCAVQYYLDNRDAIAAASRSAPVPQWEAVIYATAAWNAVLTEERALLPMADELSGRALDIAPGVGGVLNATRGAALLALGAHDEGKALLARGIRETTDQVDKSDLSRFLGLREIALGNVGLGEAWVRFANFLASRSRQTRPCSVDRAEPQMSSRERL